MKVLFYLVFSWIFCFACNLVIILWSFISYFINMLQEVPENKRRVSIVKGIVIARRNAGLNTTFRIRRLVAGVGVESLYLL